MEIDEKSRKLIDLIGDEKDADKLLRHVQELNQRLEESHRVRSQSLESVRDKHAKKEK